MAKVGRPRNPTSLVRTGPLYLTEWMEHLDISDEELADKLNVAANTVWRWRMSQTRLNPAKQVQVAKALGIWPGQLWVKPNTREMRILELLLENGPPDIKPFK